MKKINKRGVLQLIIPLLGFWWVWVILLLVMFVGGFFVWAAVKQILLWAIILAPFALGLFMMYQGNLPWGAGLVALGIGLLFVSSQGYVELSWFTEGKYNQIKSDINVDHQNKLTYTAFNLRELEGVVGVFAVFNGDDFIRADYFYTATTHHTYAYKNSFENGINHEIELNDILGPGDHDIKVYYALSTHRFETDLYANEDYWNMKKCGVERISSERIKIDQDTRSFNYNWLPCSKTSVKENSQIIPANVLGPESHFHYSSLNSDEIDQFKTLNHQDFEILVPGTETPIIPDPEPEPEDKGWFASVGDWFVGIFSSLRITW